MRKKKTKQKVKKEEKKSNENTVLLTFLTANGRQLSLPPHTWKPHEV